jgi:hypothetical protein
MTIGKRREDRLLGSIFSTSDMGIPYWVLDITIPGAERIQEGICEAHEESSMESSRTM